MLTRIRHVGIMVRDMEASLALYQRLFHLKPSNREELPEYGLRNALLPMEETFLELLQPTTDASAGATFLKRRGEGLYILVFQTPDRDAALAALRLKGAAITGTYEGGRFTNLWVHPRSTHGVFIELLEPSRENPWPPGGEGWQRLPRDSILKDLKQVVVIVRDLEK
ncbi:MAG: VOC family protein, partial [Dehalococcoidia bacterium]